MRPECELCGASFPQQSALEAHMQRTHGETTLRFDGMLFECGDCERSYLQREDLNLHVERKHTA